MLDLEIILEVTSNLQASGGRGLLWKVSPQRRGRFEEARDFVGVARAPPRIAAVAGRLSRGL